MSIEDLQEQEIDTTQESQTEEWTDDSSEDEVREAQEMGWKNPKDWKGEPPKNGFVKASEFVKRGKEILPIVQAQVKKKDEELSRLRDELDRTKRESDDKLSRLERMSSAALKQQRKNLEEKYEALKENVIETGDKAEYKRLVKEEKEALEEFDEAIADKKAEGKGGKDKSAEDDLPASMRQVVKDWVAENPWFTTDEEMNAVASRRHERLLKEKPGLSLAENLEEVRAYVAKRYPEKFGKDGEEGEDDETPRRGSRVEGGSRQFGGGAEKTAWAKLPKEAQVQADRFIKDDSLFLEKGETVDKDLQKARERYAKKYLEDFGG